MLRTSVSGLAYPSPSVLPTPHKRLDEGNLPRQAHAEHVLAQEQPVGSDEVRLLDASTFGYSL